MFCSDAVTSSTLRVFRPQSGLTQTCRSGMDANARAQQFGHLVALGTRGEWMS